MRIRGLEQSTDDFIYNTMHQFDTMLDKAIYQTNNELYNEADRMYKSFIRQFYLYKTKSYIRDGEGRPGTREGQRLYDGEDIYKISHGRNPKLVINLPDEAIYNHSMDATYKFDEPETVLDYVMHGIRYPYRPNFDNKNWIGVYIGTHFSYAGTMYDAFKEFGNKFNQMAGTIIKKELKKKGIKL